jgi:hypothetical protein
MSNTIGACAEGAPKSPLAALVARAHRRGPGRPLALRRGMDEHPPILPPPPSTRLALWASLNALWFRVVDVLARWSRRAVQVARHASVALGLAEPTPAGGLPGASAPSMGTLARQGRFSTLFGRLCHAHQPPGPGDDRPTKVEGRRP